MDITESRPAAILNDFYEAIVIGAGIGGLTTAALLANEGLEVLLLEQSHKPGGCCTSFREWDFTFNAAASRFQGFGQAGFNVLRSLFDFLSRQVELIPRDVIYRMYFGDSRIDFLSDRHAFTSELGAVFPERAGSLISFMKELERVYGAMLLCGGPSGLSRDEPWPTRAGHFLRHPLSRFRVAHHMKRNIDHLLGRFSIDSLARSFFQADLYYTTGYRLEELSEAYAALAVLDRFIGGTHCIIGSAQQIPDRLEKSINLSGARIVYRADVREVLVEKGRATGVLLAGDRAIRCDAIVSDTTLGTLLGELVKQEHLSPETNEWRKCLESSASVSSVYMGLPEHLVPEGFVPETLLVLDPERNPESFVSVNVPSLFDPGLAPQGFHSLSAFAVTQGDIWPRPTDDEYGSAAYREKKEKETARIMSALERLLPGVSEEARHLVTATPSTFERYTRRESGALAGPRIGGNLLPDSLPGAETEIPGLFLAGDSTFFGRGIAQACASGINAARAAFRYLGVRPPRFLEVDESVVLETVPVSPKVSSEFVVDTLSAVAESQRCLDCEDAPCQSGCPARVDIPRFIRLTRASNFAGAARVIRESVPLGEVCGLVCPAERLCESRCRRARMDSPVKIGQLEAHACSYATGPEGWPEPFAGKRANRVAVIGSGPASVSCAYYLSLLGYNVEVFEARLEAGGLPVRNMPDFKLPKQVPMHEIEGALAEGIEFRGNTSFGEDLNFEILWRDGFKAVFLGTGLGSVKPLPLRGSELPGVIGALSFLGSARRKVKRELTPMVAVLGDSNMAVDTALLAMELGAERVHLVTTRDEESMEASSRLLARARDSRIELITGTVVEEIEGEGRVRGIRIHPVAGHPRSEDSRGAETIELGTVINATGRRLERSLSDYLAGQLKRNPNGTVAVDSETLMTSRDGVFAGGDVIGGERLVATACAEGRRAAISIDRYLESSSPP